MVANEAYNAEPALPPKCQQCLEEKVFHCGKAKVPGSPRVFTGLERDFSSHNFDTMAADADVIYNTTV